LHSKVTYLWKDPGAPQPYRTAVSLHGHTQHSREGLYFIPEFAARCWPLRTALAYQERRAQNMSSIRVDFWKAYWTPPLPPLAAVRLEREQIENQLDLASLISLTDHDNIEAPMLLRVVPEARAASLLRWLPARISRRLGESIREASLRATLRYYHIAQVLFAPNQELIDLLEKGTRKPCSLMQRGVDTTVFDPARRDRGDDTFVIGYVGRLTVEKNVRLLVELERELLCAGIRNFRFLVVGQGAEEPWLRANLRRAEFPGVLAGDALGRAYANMDVFVFPSRTDTYGNVVLEALASGVPAVVTDSGGPRFVLRSGENGFVAADLHGFVSRVQGLIDHPAELAAMRVSARIHALAASWDNVFESVYADYERGLRDGSGLSKRIRLRPAARVWTGAARLG
jgi:glycosyltransferase involved in cell wall biosynthesis